jgi:hypothetical protein
MNFIKQFVIRLAMKWIDKQEVIAWAMVLVKEPINEYFDAVQWTNTDATVLNDYLKTESGKRFLSVIVENKNRALQGVLSAKDPSEVEKIKGQATAWIALRSNIEILRKGVKATNTDKMSKEQIEEAFGRVMSSSIQVTSSAVRQN